jgi:hypothetical protein
MVADLRDFSADLLEPGLTSSVRGSSSDQLGSSLRATMRAVDSLCARLPSLLTELELHERATTTMEYTRIPWSAKPSATPGDYANRNGRMLPLRWLRSNVEGAVNIEPLRWVVAVVARMTNQLNVHSSRLGKQVEAARFARSGYSDYAILDNRALDLMLAEVETRKRALQQVLASINRCAGVRVSSAENLPNPYPRTAAWQIFRREANRYLHPEQFLGGWIVDLLRAPIPVADLPYLYQRWCGLQILSACERLGWTVHGDAVGVLYLGGVLAISNGARSLRLWIEPRLNASKAAEIGWQSESRTGELTPDFLFVCGEIGRRDAFVLDATLSTDDIVLEKKGAYLSRMIGHDFHVVAGVPVARRAVRSWAMAPIRSRACRLSDPYGHTGVIPLNAQRDDFAALEAWLQDIFNHASRTDVGNVRIIGIDSRRFGE